MIPRETLRKIRRIEIKARRAVSDLFAGRYQSVFKGEGMEFQEVREYLPGDDIRSIDWNVTARTGTPFVKKYREERERTLMLLVDVSASNLLGSGADLKRDLAAETAALLAFSAIANHDRVGVILFSDQVERYIPPAKGSTHVLRCVSEILEAKPRSKGTDLRPALEYLNRVQRRRAVVFLVSDFIAPDWGNLMRVTARRHDLISLVVGDRLERELPAAGLVDFADAETGRRVLVDTSDRRTRQALSERAAARRAGLLETLRREGGDAVELWTGEAVDRPLIRFFRQRESRR